MKPQAHTKVERNSNIKLYSQLTCDRLCLDLHKSDFLYYDKDGFELNLAEQKFYKLMGHKLTYCLNHNAFTQTWYTSQDPRLIVDHSLILYRCAYSGHARQQLEHLKPCVPQASLLLKTVPKWGFDFALDSIDEHGNIFEVLHIEFDSKNFSHFEEELNKIQERIDGIDWLDAANNVNQLRTEWGSLSGFEQNDWKSRFLLSWSKSEHTLKSI